MLRPYGHDCVYMTTAKHNLYPCMCSTPWCKARRIRRGRWWFFRGRRSVAVDRAMRKRARQAGAVEARGCP